MTHLQFMRMQDMLHKNVYSKHYESGVVASDEFSSVSVTISLRTCCHHVYDC